MLRCSLLCDSLCFFLLQDELDRDYAGVIAADLLLAPVAPAWGKGFGGGRVQLAAVEAAGPS